MDEDNLLLQICDLPVRLNHLYAWRTKLFISVMIISFPLWFDARASSFVQALKIRQGPFTVISAKPCQNALGQSGTCMFMWDCIKSEGVHLGTCSDQFLFGSCCYHNSTAPPVNAQQVKLNDTYNSESKPQRLNPTRPLLTTPFASLIKQPQMTSTSTITATKTTTTPAPKIYPTKPFLHSTSTLSHQTEESKHSILWQNSDIDNRNTSHGDNYTTTVTVIHQDDKQYNASETTSKPILASQNLTASTGAQWITVEESGSTTVTSSTPSSLVSALLHSHTPMASAPHSDINSVIPASPAPTPASNQPIQTIINPNNNPQPSSGNLPTPSFGSQSQIAQRPTHQPPTTFGPIYMNPLAPAHNQLTNIVPQQQSKPQGVSWLSKPSLIANAIFHSFKPYLNPSRHRPTYKPYINSGYRPQHYRPILNQHVQQSKPLLFFSGHQQHQTSNSEPTPVTTVDSKPPNRVTSTNSLYGDDLNSNNDHHIVNPSTSSMTDRHRPMDKNHYNSAGSLQQSHKNNQYELLTNSSMLSASLLNTSSHESLGTNIQPIEFPNTNGANSTLEQNSSVLSSGQSTNHLGSLQNQVESNYTHTEHDPYTCNTTYQIHQSNHSVIEPILTLPGNLSRPSPSYPLISSLSNHVVDLPTTGSIDEIHGLSTINSPASDQYNKPGQVQSASSPASSDLVSTTTLVGSNPRPMTDNYIGSSHHQTADAQSAANDSPFPDSTTLPPGTVLIGNIDEPPLTTSSISIVNIHPNSPTVTTPSSPSSNTISEPTDVSTASTTSPVATQTSNTIKRVPGSGPQIGKDITCGVTSLYPQTKVVGGKNAAFGAWPWQVSVRKVSFFGFSSTHRCGGAVISSEWIATAGHCVEDLALQSIRIRVGEYDFSSVSEPYSHIERAARRKVVHPKYNFYTYENDLALVQLDQPLQFPPHVAPICLPPDNIDLLGRNATVTGWGRLNEGGTLPTILQEVRVPIVSNDKCKDMFLNAGRPEYIPDIFLCAGYEEGGRDSCQGDSGGPLQVRGDDGKWFLAGIISWGIGCAEQNLPGVCTRISRFKLWIQSTINSNS